jgi:hypothetical protein
LSRDLLAGLTSDTILYPIMVKSFVRLVPTKFGDIAVSVVEQTLECLEIFGTPWTQSPQETLFGVVALCLFRFSGLVVM